MTHAWKFEVKSFVVFALSVLSGTILVAQSNSPQASLFLNPKKAPAILELSAEKELVRNTSSKTIVRFSRGCVTPVDGKPITLIDMVLTENNSRMAPGQLVAVTDIEPVADFHQPLAQVCASRQSKLAVVDVLFSDGTRWTILKTRWRVIPVPLIVVFRQEDKNRWLTNPYDSLSLTLTEPS